VGFIVNVIQGFPTFEPVAMLGGLIWCIGNCCVVPIVSMIGLSLGLLIWGTASLIMGWSSGTFGLFDLHKQEVAVPLLNYIGVGCAVVAIGTYVFVKTNTGGSGSSSSKNGYDPLMSVNYDLYMALEADSLVQQQQQHEHHSEEHEPKSRGTGLIDRLSDMQKKLLGVALSLMSGVCYGANYNPVQYVIDHAEHYPGASKSGLDYTFSHFTGIFLTSTAFFVIYLIIKRNDPWINPRSILPSFVSGAMWAVAQSTFFVANTNLQITVAFPIVSIGPGVVAALWGIFAFGEIRGLRNYLVLALAFFFSLSAVTLITLSKILKPEDLHM
jgi:glucose uptake protein GlcU